MSINWNQVTTLIVAGLALTMVQRFVFKEPSQ